MNRRILDITNLVEAIDNKMISVVSVENKVKTCEDTTQIGRAHV